MSLTRHHWQCHSRNDLPIATNDVVYAPGTCSTTTQSPFNKMAYAVGSKIEITLMTNDHHYSYKFISNTTYMTQSVPMAEANVCNIHTSKCVNLLDAYSWISSGYNVLSQWTMLFQYTLNQILSKACNIHYGLCVKYALIKFLILRTYARDITVMWTIRFLYISLVFIQLVFELT